MVRSETQIAKTMESRGFVTLTTPDGEIVGLAALHDISDKTAIPGYKHLQDLKSPAEYGSVFVKEEFRGNRLYPFLAAGRLILLADSDINSKYHEIVSGMDMPTSDEAAHVVAKTYARSKFPELKDDKGATKRITRARLDDGQKAAFLQGAIKTLTEFSPKGVELVQSSEFVDLVDVAQAQLAQLAKCGPCMEDRV